ncbi:MAG: hypothetical protein J6F30_10945 [Cellulosilyticum sp.]|nr:hypothetical protein [Cellulosilyticum sp.]
MGQLIFGLFCIVFGGTVTFMKKYQIIDLIFMGKQHQYEDKLYKLDKFILVTRILSAIVGLLGIYISIMQAIVLWQSRSL